MKPRDALTVVAVILMAVLYVQWCHDPQIRRTAIQGVADTADNRTIARLKTASVQREAVFRHQQDSTGRVIARLRARIPRAQSDTAGGRSESLLPADTLSPSGCAGAPSACDSLIVALDAQHVQDSLQVAFWKSQAVSYRDTLVPRLTAARDLWKKAAHKKFVCVGGPGAVVSLDGRVTAGFGGMCGIRF